MGTTDVNASIARVFELFAATGDGLYVGEQISQLEHALQCGKCAADSGADDAVIIGALLHDVGHMLGLAAMLPNAAVAPSSEDVARMGEFGVVDHERLGADWLRNLGFPERVVDIVRNHVAAKRYLCWRSPAYMNKLSVASTATLGYQGGPMNDAEVRRRAGLDVGIRALATHDSTL